MLRSYENLLGRDEKKPMPRSGAKRWLRGLPLEEAEELTDALVRAKPTGTTHGSVLALVPTKEQPPELPEGDRPFAHPTHWPAFVLVGTPSDRHATSPNGPTSVRWRGEAAGLLAFGGWM